MREIVQSRVDLLLENQKAMRKAFCLEDSLTTGVVAASYAEKDKAIDTDSIKEARKLLKKKQGIFSDLRAYNEITISARMALSGNPEKYLDELSEVYDKLKKGKLFGSAYRVLAAMTVVDLGRFSEADRIVERTNEIMKGMLKQHPFLTTEEDTCFAVILAITNKSVEDILDELEESYKRTKKLSINGDSAYSLSQVLTAYTKSAEEKADKAAQLLDAFKAVGITYGRGFELPSLGVLIGIDADKDEIVKEVIEVSDLLKGKMGFGFFDLFDNSRLMFGSMLVSGAYLAGDCAANASGIGNDIGRVLALETVIFITMMYIVSMSVATTTCTTSSCYH